MKRSQAFIQHQNKVIQQAAKKESDLQKRQDMLMKTAKREAEDKIKEAEDSVKQMKLKKAEAEEKQVKLQREISGLKQAWGVSNSTRDKEIRMIKQTEALNLQQQLEKAKRQAFEEGEQSGQVKFQ